MIPRPSRVLVTNPDRQLPCHFSKTVLRIPSKRELPVFLCQRYEPVPPATRQTPADLPHCSSRQGWPGRMPVPDVRWLHRDRGKCLWTFSFCSNARSFDCPTMAKPGGKIRIPCYIRRKGAEVFCPALAFGGFVDGLQVSTVMPFLRFRRWIQPTLRPMLSKIQDAVSGQSAEL